MKLKVQMSVQRPFPRIRHIPRHHRRQFRRRLLRRTQQIWARGFRSLCPFLSRLVLALLHVYLPAIFQRPFILIRKPQLLEVVLPLRNPRLRLPYLASVTTPPCLPMVIGTRKIGFARQHFW